MAVWKLYPVARSSDPHWLDHTYKRPLLVEARSASEARLKAANWERSFIYECYGNESPAYRSAFESEKLYGTIELQEGKEAAPENLLMIS